MSIELIKKVIQTVVHISEQYPDPKSFIMIRIDLLNSSYRNDLCECRNLSRIIFEAIGGLKNRVGIHYLRPLSEKRSMFAFLFKGYNQYPSDELLAPYAAMEEHRHELFKIKDYNLTIDVFRNFQYVIPDDSRSLFARGLGVPAFAHHNDVLYRQGLTLKTLGSFIDPSVDVESLLRFSGASRLATQVDVTNLADILKLVPIPASMMTVDSMELSWLYQLPDPIQEELPAKDKNAIPKGRPRNPAKGLMASILKRID